MVAAIENTWQWWTVGICAYLVGFLLVGRWHRRAWNRWIRYESDGSLGDNMTVVAAVFWPLTAWVWIVMAAVGLVTWTCIALHDGRIVHGVARLLK